MIGARWYSGLGYRFFVSTQFTFVAGQQFVIDDTWAAVRFWSRCGSTR